MSISRLSAIVSDDPEIEFNLNSSKRKRTSSNEITLTDFVAQFAFANLLKLPADSWNHFKEIFTNQYLFLKHHQTFLVLKITEGRWKSNVCLEEDQTWPEKAPVDQTYEYITASSTSGTYFEIRRGLQGRVGELINLHNGPLLTGKEALDLSMRIINFLKIDRVMLNDDAEINGLETRLFLPVVSLQPKTLYTEAGFELWENNPTVAYDHSEFNAQSKAAYVAAYTLIRDTKLNRLSSIDMASRDQIESLKEMCPRYGEEYQRATIHSLGAAIFSAFKVPVTRTLASCDFRTFYQICFFASDSSKAKSYNRALDTLFRYKFWIKINPS